MKPIHKHDCEKCEYLGTIITPGKQIIDLYAHEYEVHGEQVTFIARISDEGSDYISSPDYLIDNLYENSPLKVAKAIYEMRTIRARAG